MTLFFVLWLVFVVGNLTIQIVYFFFDENRILFLGKKITTPFLLLLSALALLSQGSLTESRWISMVVLFTMAIGELGIEGSSVVESKGQPPSVLSKIMETTAGVLFLLVNMVLGGSLILLGWGLTDRNPLFLIGILTSTGAVVFLLLQWIIRILQTPKNLAFQMFLYTGGIWILLSGAVFHGILNMTPLVLGALILSFSDTLVLIRMGAPWRKTKKRESVILFVFLIVILLLYYWYMFVMGFRV